MFRRVFPLLMVGVITAVLATTAMVVITRSGETTKAQSAAGWEYASVIEGLAIYDERRCYEDPYATEEAVISCLVEVGEEGFAVWVPTDGLGALMNAFGARGWEAFSMATSDSGGTIFALKRPLN